MTDRKDSTKPSTEKQQGLIDDLETASAATPTPPAPPEVITLPKLPPKEYDIDGVLDFIFRVFHTKLQDDEFIQAWTVDSVGKIGYPLDAEGEIFEHILKTKREPLSLYFGTATCWLDSKNKLRNAGANFAGLHVVVLDDIGTKVPIDKIPKDLPPSYILETSKGNFQYGYILNKPIRDLDAATALVQLIYDGGFSDEGGKMATKLVRLPDGVNLKPGNNGFVTRLTKQRNKVYTPQELLDGLRLEADWEAVAADPSTVITRRAKQSTGTTPWSPIKPAAAALNGYIDPVLEWLLETDQVMSDNDGWVVVKCPMAAEHSTGTDDLAGYSPLGRGDEPERRAFHCFHTHGATFRTADYLQYVFDNSGIQAAAFDPSVALTSQYAFDPISNAVWDIKSQRRDVCIGMDGFRNLHPHKMRLPTPKGDKVISSVELWKTSPSRVNVMGPRFDPSTTARLVESEGDLYVNQFFTPEWHDGRVDMEQVDKFNAFLKYLVPKTDERKFFTMWLAAKIQNMAFRGAAVVMVATQQGVGRSTLSDMIGTLIGGANLANVPLAQMIGTSQFNEWQEKPFVVVEETLAAERSEFYSNYEKLKGFVDPRSVEIEINPKTMKKRKAINYASYLFLSNHANALALPDNDRRFYVIMNAQMPKPPKYFMELNEWLDEKDFDGSPLWARHVYRWLKKYPVDMELMLAPAQRTAAKSSMINEAKGLLEYACDEVLKRWPTNYVSYQKVFEVMARSVLCGPIHFDEEANKNFIRRQIKAATCSYSNKVQFRVNGKLHRPLGILGRDILPSDASVEAVKSFACDALRGVNTETLAEAVAEDMRQEGRI